MKLIKVIQSKIVKKDNKYQVQSEKGKNLGTYDTKEEAEKRLKQVEMFKHMNKKASLLTYSELSKWHDFPSEEQLKKEYEQFLFSKEHDYNFQNPYKRFPKSFEDFKQIKVEEWKDSQNTTQKNNTIKYVGDGWEETDEDPIEDIIEREY